MSKRLSLGMAAVIGASSLVGPSFAPVQAQDLPPQARPGECYGRVVTPPTYGRVAKKVLERAAWTETRTGRSTVERQTRKVLVKPERTERVRTPAVYETKVSWVTKPGVKRTVRELARYKVVTDKILVEPARAEWRLTSAPLAYGETRGHQTMLEPTGEVYCRVLIPARYDHVKRKVKVASGRTYVVQGKPRRVKVTERVQIKPAGWADKRMPAVYRTEVVKETVRPGRKEVVRHPAVYRTVQQTELVKPAGQGWALVVCGGELHPVFVQRLEWALTSAGYDAGPPDGVADAQTYAGLRLFQRDRGLAQGQLTVESARALGVL
jgi:hypothetical protein